ncbi:MAG: elongator complex protein 3 [bacterium]
MSTIYDLLIANHTKLKASTLYAFKKQCVDKLGKVPRDSDILAGYRELVKDGKIVADPALLTLLTTRSVRTLSGVTPFAVMTKPYVCPGMCTFCPLELGMPKSYLSDEPAAARAKQVNFDARLQIESRLTQLTETGHNTDKIELIVIGGTFSNYPESYKRAFFKDMIDTINGVKSDSLEEAQVFNEAADRRIVGISVETRPDWIDETEVRLLRELGVTKIQVGVQAFDEEILRRIKRGHTLDRVGEATRLLKDAGIKVCYHFMPNLPGSNPDLDRQMAHLMYEDPRFKPDFLKIYPAQVIAGTEMFREWERGEFTPYSDDLLKDVLKDIKKITPPFVRIDRLVRDISKKWVAAGTKATNMRQYIQLEMKQEGWSCQCIRCREVKARDLSASPILKDLKIETLGGTEHLLTFEGSEVPNFKRSAASAKDSSEPCESKLYSLLRLRLPAQAGLPESSTPLFKELAGCAIIRELHTYGKTVQHEQKDSVDTQHHGLGKQLMSEAERVAYNAGFRKIAVISSIGTRDYYRKLGYEREGLYMTKKLDEKNQL